MPTYEYACSACSHEWEQSQRITEAPVDVCPACSKTTAHRLISAGTNFILKGGGWYSDLYSSPKPSNDAAKPASEGTEKKAEAKGGNADAAPSATPDATAKPATKPGSAESASTSAGTSSGTSGTSSGASSAPTT